MVAGFYRTCVIDTVLAQSPAEYVRRPSAPAESPALGLSVARCPDRRPARTTMRYDRARPNLDRHPNILAAYIAAGT